MACRYLAGVLLLAVLAADRGITGEAPVQGERAIRSTLEWRNEGTIAYDYLVFLPDGYDRSARDWPMVVYLYNGGNGAEG